MTPFRCGGKFDDSFVANVSLSLSVSERILEINQSLAKYLKLCKGLFFCHGTAVLQHFSALPERHLSFMFILLIFLLVRGIIVPQMS